MNVLTIFFKKPKFLNIKEEIKSPVAEEVHKTIKPELDKLHKSVKVLEKENKKMILTLEEAMAIITSKKVKELDE